MFLPLPHCDLCRCIWSGTCSQDTCCKKDALQWRCHHLLPLGIGSLLVQVFGGLLIGAMLPYWFSSMTMKSVGKAALAMVEEVRMWTRKSLV